MLRPLPSISNIDRNTAIKTGALLVLLLAAVVLGLNLYAFYSAFLFSPAKPQENPPSEIALTAQDLEDVIKLLDERQKRFNEILGGKENTVSPGGIEPPSRD